jgi:hypothetical protein
MKSRRGTYKRHAHRDVVPSKVLGHPCANPYPQKDGSKSERKEDSYRSYELRCLGLVVRHTQEAFKLRHSELPLLASTSSLTLRRAHYEVYGFPSHGKGRKFLADKTYLLKNGKTGFYLDGDMIRGDGRQAILSLIKRGL